MNLKKPAGKKILYPLVAVLLIITAYFASQLRRKEVDAVSVEKGTVEETVFEEETRTRLDVIRTVSVPISGKVARIVFEVGDRIESGELITTIEDEEILNAIKGAEAHVEEIEARIEGLPSQVPREAELKAAKETVRLSEEEKKAAGVHRAGAEKELAYAEKQYDRIAKLRENNVVSQEHYDYVRLEYELAEYSEQLAGRYFKMAEMEVRISELKHDALKEAHRDIDHLEKIYSARIEQILAELHTLRHQAEKTQILSPLCGIITQKHLDSRTTMQAGQPLIEIGCPASIEVESKVLSADISRVEPGQKVVLEGGILGDESIAGTVDRIHPHGFTKVSALGIEQQRFRVIIKFDHEKNDLPPGADLDARIIVREEEDVLHIPHGAIFSTAEGPAVFRISGGRAWVTHVLPGIYGEERVEIISGLDRGDAVIVRPPAELEPGHRVTIKN